MLKQLPLHEFWKSKGADFYEDYGYKLPLSFSNSRKEYEGLKQTAGIVDFSARGKVKVTGNDRVDLLQRILTQDIKSVKAGGNCYSAFLTSKGKVIADMQVYVFEDHILLDTEIGIQTKLIEGLNKLIIIEDVILEDVSEDFAHFALFGNTEPLFEKLCLDTLEAPGCKEFTVGAVPAIQLTHQFKGTLFQEVITESSNAENLINKLLNFTCVKPIGYEAYEAARIEMGILRYGKDISEEFSLPETGLDAIAASETKGCYPGQEVVARTNTYKGHTKKCIQMKLEENKIAGDKIYFEGNEAGRITSATPLNNHAIAYIRKEFFDTFGI